MIEPIRIPAAGPPAPPCPACGRTFEQPIKLDNGTTLAGHQPGGPACDGEWPKRKPRRKR